MYKSTYPGLNSFKNIYKLLHKKTEYLKNLEKRKNKSYSIINKRANELIKDNIIKKYNIERNYQFFSKNGIYIPNKSSKIHFTPNIKQKLLSPEESNNYPRYENKKFNIDNFSLIYKDKENNCFPKSKVFIYNKNNTINNNRYQNDFNKSNNIYLQNNNENSKNNKSTSYTSFLTSVGNSIIIKNN